MTNFYPDTPVYQYFKNWQGICDCVQTPWRDKESENSLSFACSPGKEQCRLEKLFGTKFGDKFRQAASGHEKDRITTLHSSALLSLLCFHRVSDDAPLQLNIGIMDYRFTESFFEVKNPIEKGRPSNMDVVLYGKCNSDNKPVLLYLESKFTEFLTQGNQYGINPETYLETYEDIFGKDLSESLFGDIKCRKYQTKYQNRDVYRLKLDGSTHYCGGIKQMISHYMGLRCVLSDDNRMKRNDLYDRLKGDPEILLGSIIYDFEGTTDALSDSTTDYKACYNSIAEALNGLHHDRIQVIPDLLTYQEVFKEEANSRILTSEIKDYYQLG